MEDVIVNIYLVGAWPCNIIKSFEDKKEAKLYCKEANSRSKKYQYQVKTLKLVKQK